MCSKESGSRPTCQLAGLDVVAAWDAKLGTRSERRATTTTAEDKFDKEAAAAANTQQRPQIAKGQRLRIYWTEEDEWYQRRHPSQHPRPRQACLSNPKRQPPHQP